LLDISTSLSADIMAQDTEDISEYMNWYTWAMLSRTERALKNLTLDREFPDQDAMQSAMESAGFEWAPGLLECMQSSTPPTVSYFKDLPMHGSTWAVYVLVLEIDNERARVYISSGTKADRGVKTRMQRYDRRIEDETATSGMPAYVE
jgi:hypothetical protein